jgi:phosphatidate cytidylyltransferase
MIDEAVQNRAIAWQAAQASGGLMAAGAVMIVPLRARRRAGDTSSEVGASPRPALWLRFGTLLALAVAVFGAAAWGLWPFAVVVGVLVALGLSEFWRVLDAAGFGAYRAIGWLGGLGLVAAGAAVGGGGAGVVIMAMVLLLLARALRDSDRAGLTARLGGTLLGVLYVALPLSHLVLLRMGPGGFGKVVFVLSVVQMADVFALLGGLAFGRHKLAPGLSGGKTWEGLVCGILAAVAGAWLFAFALPGVPWYLGVALAFVLAVGALVGDLSASAIKRSVGFKDFGATLPGHGGVLDRFDSYLVAAPLAYFVFLLADRLGP